MILDNIYVRCETEDNIQDVIMSDDRLETYKTLGISSSIPTKMLIDTMVATSLQMNEYGRYTFHHVTDDTLKYIDEQYDIIETKMNNLRKYETD